MQESQADIESCSTPVLHRVQIVELVRDKRRDLEQVVRSNASSQQRLMSVAEGRVHQQKILLSANSFGKGCRSIRFQDITEARWWGSDCDIGVEETKKLNLCKLANRLIATKMCVDKLCAENDKNIKIPLRPSFSCSSASGDKSKWFING